MSGSIARTIAVGVGGGTKEMINVPVESLVILPDLDKRTELGDIEGLAKDIAEGGFKPNFPILVRVNKANGNFEVADGRRRTRAAIFAKKELGWKGTVYAIPLDSKTSDQELIFETLNSNNNHQKPFEPMEEGSYYVMLKEKMGVSEKGIADRVHKSITYVRDRIILVNMEPEIKDTVNDYIKSGVMTVTAATDLAKRPKEEQVSKWSEIQSKHETKVKEQTEKWNDDNSESLKTGKKKPPAKKNLKPNKIKVRDVSQITKGRTNNISVKTYRANMEILEKVFKDTGHDRYEFALKVLKAIQEDKLVAI